MTTEVTETTKLLAVIRQAGITLRSEEAQAFEIADRGVPLTASEEAAIRRAAERATRHGTATVTVEQIIEAMVDMAGTDLQRIHDALTKRWKLEPPELNLVDLVMTGPGSDLVGTIKAVRAIAGCGLREARDIVESCRGGRRRMLRLAIDRQTATDAAAMLREAGVHYVIQPVGADPCT